MSDDQVRSIFSLIEAEKNQIIVKRYSNPPFAITIDDIVIEGEFSDEFLASISRNLPLPLTCKIETSQNPSNLLRSYSALVWKDNPLIFSGITLLPFYQVQQMIGFKDAI